MRSGDGVAVEERQKASEGLEEGPVGEETDALVAVNAAGSVGSEAQAGQAELRALALRQPLLGVRLIELDGCSVHLQPGRVAISTETFTHNWRTVTERDVSQQLIQQSANAIKGFYVNITR